MLSRLRRFFSFYFFGGFCVLGVVSVAVLMSCLLRFVPIFNFMTEGFFIIISALLAAALFAFLVGLIPF